MLTHQEIEQIRQVFAEELAKVTITLVNGSDAPACPHCKSEETHWIGKGWRAGSRRILCRACGKSKTVAKGGAIDE